MSDPQQELWPVAAMTTKAVIPPSAGLGQWATVGEVVVDRNHGSGGHRISLNGWFKDSAAAAE